MFKAINKQTDEAIIILDEEWQASIGILREFDKQNILVCQECRQPLRVRAGDVRLWHFAHKHLQNCSYNSESPLLLKTRAILYKWLRAKFGSEVTIEKRLDNQVFTRPIDCWIDRGQNSIAYWVIEAGMSLQKREILKQSFEQLGIFINWVFVSQMLREDETDLNNLHLTTTEREFLEESAYDELQGFLGGKTLHYLT